MPGCGLVETRRQRTQLEQPAAAKWRTIRRRLLGEAMDLPTASKPRKSPAASGGDQRYAPETTLAVVSHRWATWTVTASSTWPSERFRMTREAVVAGPFMFNS